MGIQPLIGMMAGTVSMEDGHGAAATFGQILDEKYDAAVMVAWFAGYGLGATPNAMANISVVAQHFNPSKKAILIVPIVGAFLSTYLVFLYSITTQYI